MAVNVDRPNGFRPVMHLNGAPWNGKLRPYNQDASGEAIFYGDCVAIVANQERLERLDAGDTSSEFIGVALGFGVDNTDHQGSGWQNAPGPYDPLNLERNYLPASTAGTIWVCDDPTVIFEAQEDGDSDPLELIDIGDNIDMIETHAGSTTTGVSGQELDSSSHATTAALPWKLYGFVDRADNEVDNSTTPNARWYVVPNSHQLRDTPVAAI